MLEVRDVGEAIQHYCDTLGFELDFTFGDPPVYACVGRVFTSEGAPTFIRFTNWCRDRDKVVNSGWLAILVESELDALYEDYRAKGVDVSQEIEDRHWGMREFEIRDCNGHYLRFGTLLEDQ